MNIKQLMKQAQQMQDQMQQRVSTIKVEGTAGGGMVKAEMSGNKELLSITIDKEAVDPNDIEMLQDLVKAAINEAARKVDEEMQGQLGSMMPPGMKDMF
ncbi:MAG: YbaB/EbfC family nucleoid-associated protein [Thermoanaerobaculia bacterium]|nr:YbaB/EbfC family nucleoid-associated protein [Thermoanaerobaculia bacterium]